MRVILVALALLFHVTAGYAQGMMLTGAGSSPKAAASGGGGTTTLNPSDKAANITLSGGNLIATNASGTSSVRSIASHSTGKFYCEMKPTAGGNSFDHAMGLANVSASLTAGPGSPDTNSLALYSGNATVFSAGASVGSSGVIYNGPPTDPSDVVGMAVAIDAGLIWFRVNGGNWNNDVTADPATGVGGISFTLSGPLFALANVGATSAVDTMNFGGTAYANSAPASFGNW